MKNVVTEPIDGITISAPEYLRDLYKKESGKTIDERYIQRMEELVHKLFVELHTKENK